MPSVSSVSFDGITLVNDGSSRWKLKSIQGWYDGPAPRLNLIDRPTNDGYFSPGQVYRSGRAITIVGYVTSADNTSSYASDWAKIAAIASTGNSVTLTVVDPSGTKTAQVWLSSAPQLSQLSDTRTAFQIQFVAPDPVKYGPAVPQSTGLPTQGGGLEYNLFSLGASYPPNRVNLATNPSIEIDTTGYLGILSGTISKDSSKAQTGPNSLKTVTPGTQGAEGMQYSIPSVTGGTYSVGAWVWATTGQSFGLYGRYDAGATGQVQTNFTGTSGWQWVEADGIVVPSGTHSLQLMVRTGSTLATSFWVDGLMMIQASSTGTSFDGSTATGGGFMYSWTGTAYASTSNETAVGNGTLYYGGNGYLGRVSVTNTGTAAAYPQLSISGGLSSYFVRVLETGDNLSSSRIISVGDTVVINNRTGRAVVNGQSDITSYLDNADFFSIPAGATRTIQFSGASIGGTPQLTVTFAPGYW